MRAHAFIQNLQRDFYDLGILARHLRVRLTAAFLPIALRAWALMAGEKPTKNPRRPRPRRARQL